MDSGEYKPVTIRVEVAMQSEPLGFTVIFLEF